MQVTVVDNGGLSASCTLVINVTDVDEPPYFMESSPILRSINEYPAVTVGDSLFGLVRGVFGVANVEVRDPEVGAVNTSIAGGVRRFRAQLRSVFMFAYIML